jgi:hypothetical protein
LPQPFLVVYGRSIVPIPLADVTLSFSFPEPLHHIYC